MLAPQVELCSPGLLASRDMRVGGLWALLSRRLSHITRWGAATYPAPMTKTAIATY
jgi:hypothetical protein